MKLIRVIFPLVLAFLLHAGVSIANTKHQRNGAGPEIFDGKTLKGWKTLGGNAPFKVEDGVIVGTTVLNSPNTFLVTENEYGDFVLELDIKLGAPVNSGIQTRSHYNPQLNKGKGAVYGRQVEIDPSDRKWSAGIYDESRRQWLYPLSLNTRAQNLYKSGEYNHVKIECIGNVTKTWLNGQPVAYLIDTIDQKGFIGLQVHSISKEEEAGKEIYFKNINIKTANLKPEPFPSDIFVVNMEPNSLSKQEKQSGWKLLFDGKSSNGWVGAYKDSFPPKGWVIEHGTLRVLSSTGAESTNGGDIVTRDKYKAFDLTFDFKLSPGANSGVKYFVTLTEKNAGSAIGLEYQVLDDKLHPDAKLGRDGNRTLSSLYDLITANKPERFLHPIGQWNSGRVVVYPDNRVEHYLNGAKVLEYVRGSKEFRDLVAISKYKSWNNFGEAPEGHILLQDHGNDVSFRSIKIRNLN
ncbi:3-keto-disaccharide hydrolase [Desertivirga brevis]|uniref:3-keto-disaccharide hydrolase n=1 Tax=Desertivirga brevis TaxID=2810310 RepID=UPI001A95BCAA|nr:DUF1080 domain-containing protein [Pedobacter sp. SYSU D00873]